MKSQIEHAPVFTTLTLFLEPGERFKAEAGAMLSMSPTVEIQAKSSGKGLLGTVAAAMGGEALFGSLFTAHDAGEVVLAPSVPGDIVHVKLDGETIFAQGGAYLAGAEGLTLSTQGSLKALVGGEGLFLSKISGNGDLFLSCYGAVKVKTLAAGESYIVDCGHLVAFEASIDYKIRKAAKGLFSTLASGEGLVAECSGPGKIWIQSRNLKALAGILAPFLGRSSS
jgi:uncharacterized protein (TIGR00266 family)